MINRPRDINLLYSGGSGGFLLLHLLLLSGKYQVCFSKDLLLQDIIEHQWQVKDPIKWKSTEIWPDNAKTKLLETDLQKIYFYCNPEFHPVDDSKNNFNLCLYTDYHSQNKLAYYKKAMWYLGQTKYVNVELQNYRRIIKNWQNDYDCVKDKDWPACRSFTKIKTLPEHIQNELAKRLDLSVYNSFVLNDRIGNYKNDPVYKPFLEFLDQADLCIKLQDLVNSDGQILEEIFDLPKINQKQKDLLTTWRSLHPQKLLKDIGID